MDNVCLFASQMWMLAGAVGEYGTVSDFYGNQGM